jgi:hypothetical protein
MTNRENIPSAAQAGSGAAGSGDPGTEADDAIHFVTRGVSPTEAAAVSAVLTGLLHEESAMLRAKPSRRPSAWEASQRALRQPFVPGPGRWRGFSL